MQEKVKGVILKTMDYKERDKIIWLFTESLGKIAVICKGVRSQKSKYQSLIRPILYGEFLLFKGSGTMYSLNEGIAINSFSSLSSSLELLTYGSYFVELADIMTQDNEPDEPAYKILVTALYLLETNVIDMELLTLAFEVKLIRNSGLKVGREMVPFPISKASENIIEFLLKTEMSKIHVLKLDEKIKKELKEITTFIIRDSFQRRPKSLDLLKFL